MGVRDLDSEFGIERERERKRELCNISREEKKAHELLRDRIYDKTRRSRGLIVSLEKQAPTLATKLVR